MNIDELYKKSCLTYSDIYEHVDTLRKYASEVSSVTEFGVRGTNNSTHALIKGLSESKFEKKTYLGVDKIDVKIKYMETIAQDLNINFKFVVSDSATVDIGNTDLLFIDSWHIYGHLKRELNNNHTKVNKYIIMHDTTVDEFIGESVRNGWNINQQSKETGYSVEEITKGLWPAILEFIEQNKEWKIKERFTNNNGLTILERI